MTDFVPPEASAQGATTGGWKPPEAQSRIMKLAKPLGGKTAGPLESLSEGMVEPFEGALQLGAHVLASDTFSSLTGQSPAMQAYSKKQATDIDRYISKEKTDFDQAKANAGRTGFDAPELAGNIISPANFIPIERAAGAANAVKTAAPSLGRVVRNGLVTMGKRGAIGGGVASIQPITGGDYWDEKTKQTAVGLGAGVILPPVINGVLHGSGAVAAPIVNWIAKIKGPNVVESTAAQEIIRRMAQDRDAGGPTAQDMIDLLTTAPHKPQAIADVAGENVKALTGRLARQPGPARQTVSAALNDRDLDAGLRLSDDVNKNIASGSSHAASHALMDARAHAAAPLYKDAFEANQNIVSPAIDRILKTPAGKAALGAARVKMQNDMSLLGKPDPELLEQVKESGQKLPFKGGVASGLKLRTLDYVKRSMDDMIGSAKTKGERDNVRILSGLKNELVGEMDKADVTGRAGPNSTKPGGGLYKQARAAYSGPSQSLDAIETGEKVFTKAPEEIASEVKDLSPSDKEFYKLGAAATLRKRIMSTGMGGDEAKKIIGNRYLQAQLRPLFDDDRSFKKFIDSVTAENRMFDTRFNTLKGSQTAMRQAEDESPEGKAFGNAAHGAVHMMAGNTVTGARKIWQAVGDLAKREDPEVANAMARLLTSPLNQGNSAGMNLLRDFATIMPKTQNHISAMQRGIGATAPVGAIAAQQIVNP